MQKGPGPFFRTGVGRGAGAGSGYDARGALPTDGADDGAKVAEEGSGDGREAPPAQGGVSGRADGSSW